MPTTTWKCLAKILLACCRTSVFLIRAQRNTGSPRAQHASIEECAPHDHRIALTIKGCSWGRFPLQQLSFLMVLLRGGYNIITHY